MTYSSRSLYSAYVNNFDLALARIQSWSVESARSLSATSSPVIGSPNPTSFDATGGVPFVSLSANKRKRIKQWLKVRITLRSRLKLSLTL